MKKLYKIKEVCEKLQIKRWTIDRLIASKQIKTINLNKSGSNKVLRITEQAIADFIQQSKYDV